MAAEQNPQSPPASPTRESTAEPLASNAESMQETLAALGRENSTLRSEVLRLLRVESDLSRHNASLDRQSSAYKQLAELGKRFNREICLAWNPRVLRIRAIIEKASRTLAAELRW